MNDYDAIREISKVPELLDFINRHYSIPDHLNSQIKSHWEKTSSEEIVSQTKSLSLALRAIGIKKGDTVGILADSSSRWTIADMAIMCAGAVSVPLFANISQENFEAQVDLANVKYIFVDGTEEWQMFEEFSDKFEKAMSLFNQETEPGILHFEELIQIGEDFEKGNPGIYEQIASDITMDDIATIGFTSGTTGKPKGAVFTHKNVCADLARDRLMLTTEDSYLNVLPLAHIFARTVNFTMIACGVRVFYLKRLPAFLEACQFVKPTILALVPRIIEKIYSKIYERIENGSFIKRTVGLWALNLAISNKKNFFSKLMRPLADVLVYSKLRQVFGGYVRLITVGGAKMNRPQQQFFNNVGVLIIEGWGMTEAGVISSDLPDAVRYESVGIPFPGFQVKVDENGEVLVKGPSIMKGYYKNEKETKEVFTEDGWLRTGDKGRIDDDGYIYLEGRLKEYYKSTAGEWVSPVPIEEELNKDPLIDSSVVIGENKEVVTCLLFPDLDAIQKLKKTLGMSDLSNEEFLQNDAVKKRIKQRLSAINANLDQWARIRDYRFIPLAPTIEGGELTPTLKLRRPVILKKYEKLINEMY